VPFCKRRDAVAPNADFGCACYQNYLQVFVMQVRFNHWHILASIECDDHPFVAGQAREEENTYTYAKLVHIAQHK